MLIKIIIRYKQKMFEEEEKGYSYTAQTNLITIYCSI